MDRLAANASSTTACVAAALTLVCGLAVGASARPLTIPPVPALDAGNVTVSIGNAPRAALSTDYSNTRPPLFVPPVALPELNLAGDDIQLVNFGPACGVTEYIDDVTVGVNVDASGPTTCDLYVLFFDDVNPGSTSPPVFDNQIGGFYVSNVSVTPGANAFINVTGLVAAGIPIPLTDSHVGVVVIASAAFSGGSPLPVTGVSVLAAGSTPNAFGGSGPDIGVSTNNLWCDTNLDYDLTAPEQFSFTGSQLANLYLDLKLARACPACTNSPVTYSYLVNGTANGTAWSWRLESQTGEFLPIEDLNTPGSTVSTLAVTQNFASAITNFAVSQNNCVNNQIIATATPLSANQAILDITVTAVNPIDLYVGAANTTPNCLATTLPACSFNPSIQLVDLSGKDCNGNGVDDAIDIAAGTSLDTDADGYPDECCPADFDLSGFVDIEDFTLFVLTYESGLDEADYDGTGYVDSDDYDAFIRDFEIGC